MSAAESLLQDILSGLPDAALLQKELGHRPRVLVAMSGGVDSSVAAALLQARGFSVVGVTMQVWDYTQCSVTEGMGTCCSSVDVDDARAVADRFGFPFYVANCEAKFQAYVIDPFVDAYLEGKTPLPCVNCNTHLKFDHLVQKMQELECDFLATGHYAQLVQTEKGKKLIRTSTDSHKDQTYFLFTIDPQLLPKLIFPIGNINKAQVRLAAEAMGLSVAKKKDSVGICFVGKRSYADFIEEHSAADLRKPGVVRRLPDGEILAQHDGIHRFTYGQRKGLGFATGNPLYVVRLDVKTSTVWVGEENLLFAKSTKVSQMYYLDEIENNESLRVKVRYHHKGILAKIKKDPEDASSIELEFEEPVRSITPGQAAVIYRGDLLVGGGFIQ